MTNRPDRLGYWRPLLLLLAWYGIGVGCVGLVVGLFVGWPALFGSALHLSVGLLSAYIATRRQL